MAPLIGLTGPLNVQRQASFDLPLTQPLPQQQQTPPTWTSPFERSTFTPSTQALQTQPSSQPLLQVTSKDEKTGLIKSGTVRPDASGVIDLPGVGAIDTKNFAANPNVKVTKNGELEVKIPGTKHKYKLKKNADGSYSITLKKPGFWSKLGGFLKKALQLAQPFLSMIPVVGPYLSKAVSLFLPQQQAK